MRRCKLSVPSIRHLFSYEIAIEADKFKDVFKGKPTEKNCYLPTFNHACQPS